MFFDWTDILAVLVFLGSWIGYNALIVRYSGASENLSSLMNRERARWLRTALRRDLRMIDTAVLSSLQQGTGFFASACIFAIGGCFALLGSANVITEISADISFLGTTTSALVEMKLLGLVVIFAYSFFKFAWSYRLFNYCAILIGALPMQTEAANDDAGAERALERAVAMNIVAGQNFNAGLRGVFFGLAYLGWFLGPQVLIVSTVLVVGIIVNRQVRSPAVKALQELSDGTDGKR